MTSLRLRIATHTVATTAAVAALALLLTTGLVALDLGAAVAATVAILVSVAAGGIATRWWAGRLAQPVDALADTAERLAAGRPIRREPGVMPTSDLQRLADALTRMSRRFSETEATRIRLMSDLVHEIRTPLATLEAYIDGLEDGVVEADAAAWATMRDQVLRLHRLTADLREAAAAEEHGLGLHLETTDIAEVTSAAVEAILPRARAKGVDIEAHGEARSVTVRADGDRLKQVLANLLDNALRHTPAGGRIDVTLTTAGRRAIIKVADTGDGIPADQLETVFARFHRVDASRRSADGSGSGLGLTIARAIVADHGGTITAASDGPGLGSTFTITLTIPAPRSPRDPLPDHPGGRAR